jgi:hypothetical protein
MESRCVQLREAAHERQISGRITGVPGRARSLLVQEIERRRIGGATELLLSMT